MGLFDDISLGTVLTETDRVVALPRRSLTVDRRPWADATFRRPGATMATREIQATALWEISVVGGFFGPIAVGWGKTLICYLAPRALGVSRAVLLLPAPLLPNYEAESAKYEAGGFDAGSASVTVVPYHQLSDPRCSALLEELAPEAIIADEVHNLRNAGAARTRRFLRYMDAHPECRFVGMSGTMFGTSIGDGAHLAALALRRGSPLPHPSSSHLGLWSHVLDEGAIPTSTESAYFHEVVTKTLLPDPDERAGSMRGAARRAAYLRIVETAGVVATSEPSCTLPLRVEKEALRAPEECTDAAAVVMESWELPNGDFVDSDAHAVAASRNLTAGFYYSWDWDAVGGRNDAWLLARAAWARALRDELASSSRTGYDSPALIQRSLDADILRDPTIVTRRYLHWAWDEWKRWQEQQEPPPVVVTWISTYLLDDVTARYKNAPVIVWYSSSAIEDGLRERGWEVHGSEDETFLGPARPLAASIAVHGTGRNLQDWSHSVVLEPPASGVTWEQLLGRMHRPGQAASEVVCSVYAPGPASDGAISSARRKALFLQDVQGQEQRLVKGWG